MARDGSIHVHARTTDSLSATSRRNAAITTVAGRAPERMAATSSFAGRSMIRRGNAGGLSGAGACRASRAIPRVVVAVGRGDDDLLALDVIAHQLCQRCPIGAPE